LQKRHGGNLVKKIPSRRLNTGARLFREAHNSSASDSFPLHKVLKINSFRTDAALRLKANCFFETPAFFLATGFLKGDLFRKQKKPAGNDGFRRAGQTK